MNDYEAALARMNDWTADAEVLDRLIVENAEDAAQRAFATEVVRVAAERHGGLASTHDVALATMNIATRFGRSYDRAVVAEALHRDPETVGQDYLPLASAGQRWLDDDFDARLEAWAVEVVALTRRGDLGLLGGPALMSIRATVDALLRLDADEQLPPGHHNELRPTQRRARVHEYLPLSSAAARPGLLSRSL